MGTDPVKTVETSAKGPEDGLYYLRYGHLELLESDATHSKRLGRKLYQCFLQCLA